MNFARRIFSTARRGFSSRSTLVKSLTEQITMDCIRLLKMETTSAVGIGSGCIGMQPKFYWFRRGFHNGLGTRGEIPSERVKNLFANHSPSDFSAHRHFCKRIPPE